MRFRGNKGRTTCLCDLRQGAASNSRKVTCQPEDLSKDNNCRSLSGSSGSSTLAQILLA